MAQISLQKQWREACTHGRDGVLRYFPVPLDCIQHHSSFHIQQPYHTTETTVITFK